MLNIESWLDQLFRSPRSLIFARFLKIEKNVMGIMNQRWLLLDVRFLLLFVWSIFYSKLIPCWRQNKRYVTSIWGNFFFFSLWKRDNLLLCTCSKNSSIYFFLDVFMSLLCRFSVPNIYYIFKWQPCFQLIWGKCRN